MCSVKEYVAIEDFCGNGIGGFFTIKKGDKCTATEKVIFYKKIPICLISSQIAFDFFSRNDDGEGVYRGEIIKQIKSNLSERNQKYQIRWNRIWREKWVRVYKKERPNNFWVWNFDFYNAEIDSLIRILRLIEEV